MLSLVKNLSDNNNLITLELKLPINCCLNNLEPLHLLLFGRNGLSNLKTQWDTDLMLTKKCCFQQIHSFVRNCFKSLNGCGELLIGPLSMSVSRSSFFWVWWWQDQGGASIILTPFPGGVSGKGSGGRIESGEWIIQPQEVLLLEMYKPEKKIYKKKLS